MERMIFPKTTAELAASSIKAALGPIASRLDVAGDLRMGLATLSKIEVIAQGLEYDRSVAAMATEGWRKLRGARGPISFAKDGWPKCTLFLSTTAKADLLGTSYHGNFEVLLFLRTGTPLFMRGMLGRLRMNGLVLRPDRGLCRGDRLVAWTERGIFAESGIPYVEPRERFIFDPERFVESLAAGF